MSLADVTLERCRMENICSLGRCCSLLPAQSTSYSHLIKQTPLNWSYSCSWSTINLVYTPTSQTLMQDSPSLSSGLISCGWPCLPLIYPPCLPSVPDLEIFLSILVLLVAVRCFHSTTALQCESFPAVHRLSLCRHTCPRVACVLWRHTCWLSNPLPSRLRHLPAPTRYHCLILNWSVCEFVTLNQHSALSPHTCMPLTDL